MSGIEDFKEALASANYVAEVNHVLSPLGRSPQTWAIAGKLLNELISGDFTLLRGSANEWFNLATSAGRARNVTAEHRILEEAIKLHPDDVDLRLSLLQLRYTHGTVAQAEEVLKEIEDLGEDRYSPSWRYWAFAATLTARYLNDKYTAVEYLDKGLRRVPPADLLNIYRHYRVVLIDGFARPSAAGVSAAEDHAALTAMVEQKFREGLRLGIEDGYVLAVDLARLLRERSAGVEPEEAARILDEALAFLDVAERTYTHDSNHPLEEIYVEKAITLMARRRYADALQILRSLPDYLLDDSLRVMANYAANMTGQEFMPSRQRDGGAPTELAERVDRLESLLGQIVQRLTAGD